MEDQTPCLHWTCEDGCLDDYLSCLRTDSLKASPRTVLPLTTWTWGTDGCPFRCSTYFPEPIQYQMGMCPRSEDLLARSVSVSIGPFYEEEDLDDIVTGLQKVAYHLVEK